MSFRVTYPRVLSGPAKATAAWTLRRLHGRTLEILANERPDLIFLDFMMPVMDGSGVLRAIARNPELVGVPIVLMSSMPEPTGAERCSGYAAFMHKPFKIPRLIALTAGLIVKKSNAGA